MQQQLHAWYEMRMSNHIYNNVCNQFHNYFVHSYKLQYDMSFKTIHWKSSALWLSINVYISLYGPGGHKGSVTNLNLQKSKTTCVSSLPLTFEITFIVAYVLTVLSVCSTSLHAHRELLFWCSKVVHLLFCCFLCFLYLLRENDNIARSWTFWGSMVMFNHPAQLWFHTRPILKSCVSFSQWRSGSGFVLSLQV